VNEIQQMSILPRSPSTLTVLAQIDRLPPEVLAAIFVHLSKSEPTLPGRDVLHFVQDLVSVTHVCRFWRQVAINAPDLWTEIKMSNLEAVKTFLERSGVVPLHVDLRPANGDLILAVAPHVYRFRRVSVSVGAKRYNAFTSFTTPAPLLERLEIHCFHHYPGVQQFLLFDDQAPKLRELVIVARSVWMQNRLGNLTSLHLTLFHTIRTHLELLPFFDMLHRCPGLEELFILWYGWQTVLVMPAQLPVVPLHRLRKLTLRSFRIESIKCLLHTFELTGDGIAIHLHDVHPGHVGGSSIPTIQTVFPNDNRGRPALVSCTKLELIFHTRPRSFIVHAVGPGFSIRIDMYLDVYVHLEKVNFTFYNVFPSVKELWVRGSSRWDTKLEGFEHFPALEKLVLNGKGSNLVRNVRQTLSPDHSGTLPCPLLTAIDCYANESEMREIFLLVRSRSSAGRQLETLSVPSTFLPLPARVRARVRDVKSLDTPSRPLHTHSMELPASCFAKEHEWWMPWKSRLD
jgi:hypothetical protein